MITLQPHDITRFWNSVAVTPNIDDCWEWKAGRATSGYGYFYYDHAIKRKSLGAHRFAWVIVNGDIPQGLYVCHRCDNRGCCNPNHLFLGTHLENLKDMRDKNRQVTLIGESSPSHKLTNEQVISIRQQYAAGGISYRKLARDFGMSHGQIGEIVRGKWWKHVVNESDVVELKQCPACNGVGYLSIRNGDDDQQCPICGDAHESDVF